MDELRAATGMSVLVATHRPEEAARCDRLVVLHDGEEIVRITPDWHQGHAICGCALFCLRPGEAARFHRSQRQVLQHAQMREEVELLKNHTDFTTNQVEVSFF